MLSNKLTFSLASLIVLLAFGLVFVAGDVWAHNADQIGSLRTHDHPTDALDAQDNNNDGDTGDVGEAAVTAHHAHPVPTITLKQETGKAEGTEAVIGAAPNDVFTVVVSFNVDVNDDGTATDQAITDLSATDITVRGSKGTTRLAATDFTVGTIVLGTDGMSYEVPYTVAANGMPDATDSVTIRVDVVNSAVFAKQIANLDLSIAGETINGGASSAGNATFTLVQSLTPPATIPEVVEITSTAKVHGGGAFTAMFKVTDGADEGTTIEGYDVAMVNTTPTDYFTVTGGGYIDPGSFADTTPTGTTAYKMYAATISVRPGTTTAVMVDIADDTDFMLKSGTMMLTVPHATTPADQTPDPEAKVEGEVPLSGSITANGFFVIGTSAAMANSGLKTAANLTNLDIDLEEFFLNGGEILVVGPSTATAKDVVISEIMWGSDAAKSPMTASQWIELYNTKSAAVSLAGWKLEFIAPDGTPKGVGVEVDKATNLGPVGYWAPLGQSGRSSSATIEGVSHAAVDIISMYRNIDYAKVEKGDHNTDAAKNRTTQLEGVPDGRIVGSWKASTRPPLNLLGRRVGTPGAKHYLRVSTTPTALDQKVIINEIGNGSGDSNDWVELLNTTSSEINLKKWELSVVTGTNAAPKDDKLIEFPDNDNTKIPANGILLLTNTPPTDSGNDLSAGVEADVKPEDQPKRGSTALYYPDAGLKLPDNGKFLLVLRSAIDKNAKPEAIIDAGGVLFLEVDNDTTYNTQVWPLQATAKGHSNVIDAADEAFSSGQVYQRNAKNSGIGEKHWKKVGFTGIGYDRTAAKEDSNGGTPGYPNDGLKEKIADLASNAEITISEIMFDGGPGRRQLPQWVELYNSSMTQAVNLNAWKLEIQNANSEDVDSRLNATITLKAMTVAPNETVLIASSSGLNSGSNHFPSTRLVNLWTDPDHRAALEMTSRNDKILSSTGLYLKLTDKDNKPVDAVGNLDGNKRTNDDPAWELPMSDEEGRRSSIIRRYEEGVAIDGMTSAGWVAASQTDLAYAISHTFYGSADDLGTPGFRGGGPLPVSLSSFRPVRDKATGAVVVRWVTQSELNNAGFNILRSETKTGEFKVVNIKGIIPGHGTTSEKHVYTWTDTSAKPNVVYYYQIEDVSLDGDRTTLATTHLRGNVNAAGKLTTRWSELKTYGK